MNVWVLFLGCRPAREQKEQNRFPANKKDKQTEHTLTESGQNVDKINTLREQEKDNVQLSETDQANNNGGFDHRHSKRANRKAKQTTEKI